MILKGSLRSRESIKLHVLAVRTLWPRFLETWRMGTMDTISKQQHSKQPLKKAVIEGNEQKTNRGISLLLYSSLKRGKTGNGKQKKAGDFVLREYLQASKKALGHDFAVKMKND